MRDYAQELGISDKLLVIERGIPFSQLWGVYAACDAFLLASKAEGYGLPLLEAMACGLPVVATNCTAITESLADGRGKLINYDYIQRNPFGNERRYMASLKHGAKQLLAVYRGRGVPAMVERAKLYAEGRTWAKAARVLLDEIEALYG